MGWPSRQVRKEGDYKALENQVKMVAEAIPAPLFPCQWALWDWIRGVKEDHNIF
jgi:hypothetical protein